MSDSEEKKSEQKPQRPKKDKDAVAKPRAQWCVVANIRERVKVGPKGGEVREGHPHFVARSKMHIVALDREHRAGGELKSIGRHQETGRLACMVVRRRFLTGWRVKFVHTPRVLTMMAESNPEGFWTEQGAKNFVSRMLAEDASYDVPLDE